MTISDFYRGRLSISINKSTIKAFNSRFTFSLQSGPAFYQGFFPANPFSFFHFKSFLITFDWLEKSLDRKPAPIEAIM